MEIAFDYTRSLGPVLGQFMTGLRERRILGARGADGTVHAPPFEYDPVTYRPPAEFVDRDDAGVFQLAGDERPQVGGDAVEPLFFGDFLVGGEIEANEEFYRAGVGGCVIVFFLGLIRLFRLRGFC